MNGKRPVDDQEAARHLTYCAVLKIRAMARRRRTPGSWPDDDYVARIAWLADLVHNVAGGVGPTRRWPPWRRRRHRPLVWTWRTADPAGRRWIVSTLDDAGLTWSPPPGEGEDGAGSRGL
ncbi:hypothetical protein ACIP98_24130 [Streptomyces sp. NPDC088354]|uniref:hypothetical protein n=1 Tax=Streptomyces sp. NPDC088354 TaxID=3365856 RepID=UPI00382F5701